jgi:hypothetical protein
MTIRYTCVKCGSVLKIQEDRIGKEKHCPKCKTTFVVPAPEDAVEPASVSAEDEQAAAPEKPAPAPAPEKVAAANAKSAAIAAPAGEPDAGDADFDPVAFLMTEGGSAPEKGQAKRAVAAASEQPDLKAARGGGGRPAAYVASDEPDVRVGGPRKTAARGDDDDSAAELLNRKPKRAPAASAAQTADEMLRVNASTNAKELLTKTMEESRIRAAQMPEERRAPGVDYKETARELGLRFAPAVLGAGLLILFAYWFGNKMAGGGPELPPLASVSGKVTKAGEPLVDAYVSFTPVDTQAGAGTAYTDENGDYELKYTEGVNGAVVGKNRVEVSKIGPNGREMVPAKTMYGQGSNVIEVVEEGSQTIDIPIP